MTQKLTQLQQAIREVCIELKELSFGCCVKIHNRGDLDYIAGTEHGERTGFLLSCRGEKLYYASDFIEIIGHPIQLQHILRAIRTGYTITPLGDVIEILNGGEWKFVLTEDGDILKYDLTKDLSAPENAPFVEWAHSIICKG